MTPNAALPALESPTAAAEPWGDCIQLPATITVDLWVQRFKVQDLLRLKPRTVINTRWQKGRDVPLRVNGQLIGWAEFEVAGDRLAVRITRLA